ncbi:ribosomal protein S18-alanine N-acetyltransferase [Fertoebacter nigrum]|uniref:[Ribosomal protein bS18]-alanine N-acetyltransferase n=1 Tax=Fertoeibacter niger TaxID=2656921 RepID=A0A8X8GXS9_9RHOB|nr:ribosomal protein S18-alanine N-acetyltransferase [Fertoeibacter niger]NUB45072.1 ribosomal protein S18-alanine N-acetyltransferase [Fertoeibacter niger]
MTPDALAALHARCFTTPPPWPAAEFIATLSSPGAFLLHESQGFLLGRVVADEAELITLATAPEARRQGIGRSLLAGFLAEAAARGAATAFLEVAADNTGALALYTQAGFAVQGRRRGYYHAPDGRRTDALILTRALV